MATITTLPRRRGALDSLHSDPTRPTRHVDWVLLVVAGLISVMGLLMIYSARHRALLDAHLDTFTYVKRQSMGIAGGLVVMAAVAAIDYRKYRELILPLFAATTFLLFLVVSPLGSKANGAQAWFQVGSFQLEPSEFAKVTLIVALAAYCANGGGDLDEKRLATALGIALVPAGLIMLQPDLGTGLVLAAIVMGVLLVGGARPRQIVVLTVLASISVFGVLQTNTLKQYQRDRLTSFVNQQGAPAYQQEQSKIAIAAGGIRGEGYLNGSQTNGSYVPEQHTDFIFAVAGEELGMVGAGTLLFLYCILVWRMWRTAKLARDLLGTLICAGAMSMVVFQVFENVGMTMGIMPITGIPLPLMSYGGSSTVAFLALIGLVENVHMRRFV